MIAARLSLAVYFATYIFTGPPPAWGQKNVKITAPDSPPTLLQKRMAKLRGKVAKGATGLARRG